MKNFIIAQWNSAGNYFSKNLRQTFFICLGIFVVTVIVNAIIFQTNPQIAEMYYQELVAVFEEKSMLHYTGVTLWLWIFMNNLIAGGLTVLSGFIPFFFLPLLSLVSNAMIIGLLGAVYQINNVGWLPLLAGILPHGMIEIPALILAATLGIHICYVIIKNDKVIGFTTNTSYNYDSNSIYKIQAVNEYGGLGEASTLTTTDGIASLTSEKTEIKAIYTIDGRQQSTMKKGLNVIKYENAKGDIKTKKIIK